MVDFNTIDLDDTVPYNPKYVFGDDLSLKERSQANKRYQKSNSKSNNPPIPEKTRAGTCLSYLDDPSARFKLLDLS